MREGKHQYYKLAQYLISVLLLYLFPYTFDTKKKNDQAAVQLLLSSQFYPFDQ